MFRMFECSFSLILLWTLFPSFYVVLTYASRFSLRLAFLVSPLSSLYTPDLFSPYIIPPGLRDVIPTLPGLLLRPKLKESRRWIRGWEEVDDEEAAGAREKGGGGIGLDSSVGVQGKEKAEENPILKMRTTWKGRERDDSRWCPETIQGRGRGPALREGKRLFGERGRLWDDRRRTNGGSKLITKLEFGMGWTLATDRAYIIGTGMVLRPEEAIRDGTGHLAVSHFRNVSCTCMFRLASSSSLLTPFAFELCVESDGVPTYGV
ncbi:hypothetical protein GYMLUDRAFT_240477 [Collybiopsis luxurians FD-317 M1]|nr:hypothetical protein GYMLUDRAFT_240477 [Collybiopsis luxurians FD-317 M1]